mmetsp:Transcript_37823/g.59014  ORF Transcript_37823/g.59014 Transcript_37823/m.59014 type:complete len:212 (-) Transcript_37823:14-649(-)
MLLSVVAEMESSMPISSRHILKDSSYLASAWLYFPWFLCTRPIWAKSSATDTWSPLSFRRPIASCSWTNASSYFPWSVRSIAKFFRSSAISLLKDFWRKALTGARAPGVLDNNGVGKRIVGLVPEALRSCGLFPALFKSSSTSSFLISSILSRRFLVSLHNSHMHSIALLSSSRPRSLCPRCTFSHPIVQIFSASSILAASDSSIRWLNPC